MKAWQKVLPFLVSVGLIGWLLYQVSPHAVLAAAAQLQWKQLAMLTIALALALYLWDGLCLRAVYATDGAPLSYRRMLHIRGLSYLMSAVHCQLGQAMVIWNVARHQGVSLVSTASRGLLLLYHDGLILISAGFAGAWFSTSPQAPGIRVFCGTALALLIGLAVVTVSLPNHLPQRFRPLRWENWLGAWTARHSLRLLLLRLGYYAIVGVYATLALRICGVDEDHATVLSAIPLVLMADSLPSVSGLGTRETALYLLLGAEHRDVLVAMGLFWSLGLLLVRLAIGLIHLWFAGEILLRPPATYPPTAIGKTLEPEREPTTNEC